MFESIWEDVKNQFRSGNMVTRIILVNLVFFVGLLLLKLSLNLTDGFTGETYAKIAPFLELSPSFLTTLTRPWVLFTHMFMHYGVLHFAFNMLWLYWFGRIMGDLIGDRKVLPIYLLSGLASAFLFMLIASLGTSFDISGRAIGASGAVFGITIAAAATAPDYFIRLIFLGDVRLKYIALAAIILQLVALEANNNSGGTFGHIGGLIMGYVFIIQLRKGNDLSIPVNRILDKIKNFFTKDERRKPTVAYRNPKLKKQQKQAKTNVKGNNVSDLSHEQTLDAILEKIKSTGMESLSEEEKEFLLNASKER
ncbi:MAG: membrane associated rhomboid family serine protease [Saprospiraceae bacterium]|jgi:membrane associated rhomboid family serine protease